MAFADKELSKIKMVALTANNQANITWYSPVDQNQKPSTDIIAGMKRRFSDNVGKGKYQVTIQVVQFYEHGQLIDTYKL
jgi:hypothetical protein